MQSMVIGSNITAFHEMDVHILRRFPFTPRSSSFRNSL